MGWARAPDRASQSCTRDVAPSMEMFQSGGQRNTPFPREKRDPRSTKEFRAALPVGAASICTSGDVEDAKEISAGAKSISPRDMLAFKAPIRSGAGNDL